jgi:hypothetical protein
MSDLEERVRKLERFRYTTLGRMNAYETLTLDLWMQIVEKSDDPIELAEGLRSHYLKQALSPGSFPGVDPTHLDLVSQEYREALEQVLGHLVKLARVAASKSGRPHKG